MLSKKSAVDPVRIGVLGCANIAIRRMLPGFGKNSEVEVVAVASRSREKAIDIAQKFNCSAVFDYMDLIDLDSVDAVYIPLPASMHDEWAERALTAGKHVLVEKPMAQSAARVEFLDLLARDKGLALMENMMFVHHSQHEAVKRLLDIGSIGALTEFRSRFAIPQLPDSDIRHRSELGGGALGDVGVYPLRAALYFMGSSLSVVSANLTSRPGRDVEMSGVIDLESDAGCVGQISFGLEHAYKSVYQLVGSGGRIVVERAFTPPADYSPVVDLHDGEVCRKVVLQADDQVARTIEAFASAVRNSCAPGVDTIVQARLLDEVRTKAALRTGPGSHRG